MYPRVYVYVFMYFAYLFIYLYYILNSKRQEKQSLCLVVRIPTFAS